MTNTPSELWDGGSYGENTGHHRAFDDQIFDSLRLTPGQSVLDIGCGVGDFTQRVATVVSPGQVVGIDQASSMIESATRANSTENLSFQVGAAQQLGVMFPEPESFDVIVSVACLHWVPGSDHTEMLEQCHRLLRPGGRLVLSFGGQGNVDAARKLLNRHASPLGGNTDPWFFPGIDEYRALVDAAGFTDAELGLVPQLHTFDTFADLTGWFDSQVLLAFNGPLTDEAKATLRSESFAEAETTLRRPDGTYHQDYVRMVVKANR